MDTRAPSDYTESRVMPATRDARRVDAHVHVWDLARREVSWLDHSRSAIHRTFLVSDWLALADPASVDSAVLVQAVNDPGETHDLLAYAAAQPRIAGVVGWVDLAAPDIETDWRHFVRVATVRSSSGFAISRSSTTIRPAGSARRRCSAGSMQWPQPACRTT